MSEQAKGKILGTTGMDRHIRVGAVLLTLIALALTALSAYLLYNRTYGNIGPEQPIPFSHRLHAGVKAIDCRFCHPYVERSNRAGVPPVAKCLFCHEYIIPEHPEILKEHEYYNSGEPVPWVKLFVVFDFVQFRHQPHLLKGFDCTVCHGDVKKMDRLPYHQFKMGFCIDCHRINKANLSCWLGCHN